MVGYLTSLAPIAHRIVVVGAVSSALLGAACGGGSPEPRTADDSLEEDAPRRSRGGNMSASSEIGALDADKVTATFQNALQDLDRCLQKGAQRNEYLGGEIAFFLKIDSSGHLAHAHAERSTLGDRDTEKCMLGALRKRTWPEPQGGDVGLARNSFDFDMPNDVRPPTDWESERVSDVLAEHSSELASCKDGASGSFTATVYVDTEGAALSVGVAASDESGEAAADCLSGVLKAAQYPSPGSWPAKVSFEL